MTYINDEVINRIMIKKMLHAGSVSISSGNMILSDLCKKSEETPGEIISNKRVKEAYFTPVK